MTPNEIGQILKELGGLQAEVLADHRELIDGQDRIEAKAAMIEAKVDKTNGRVTSIEKRHIAEDAVAKREEHRDEKWSERKWAIVVGASSGAIVTAVGFALTLIF